MVLMICSADAAQVQAVSDRGQYGQAALTAALEAVHNGE